MSDRLRVWAVVCADERVHRLTDFAPAVLTDESLIVPAVLLFAVSGNAVDCGPHRVVELAEVRTDKTQWVPAWPGTPARVDDGGEPPDAD